MTISVPPGGGIAGAEVPGTIDFDAVPVAPEIYEDSVKADRYFYFVKTPNGKYAKFRIMPDHAVDSNGRKYLGLSSCRLIWGFQSDGSRNLETVSASEPPVLFQGSL